MIARVILLLALVLSVLGFTGASAAAQEMSILNLPPGIAKQAQPLLQDMMSQMQQMNLSPEQMEMMMADMQAMANQLPPGIFLQLLEVMSQLDMSEMMQLHQALHNGGLLQAPPGQILRFARELAA